MRASPVPIEKILGEEFGRLTVVRVAAPVYSGKQARRAVWCICECRRRVIVQVSLLLKHEVESCGCLRVDLGRERGRRFARRRAA